jgi:hypothetical protein
MVYLTRESKINLEKLYKRSRESIKIVQMSRSLNTKIELDKVIEYIRVQKVQEIIPLQEVNHILTNSISRLCNKDKIKKLSNNIMMKRKNKSTNHTLSVLN